MNRDQNQVGEWDLQAYGDGLLDRDPARKRQVEEWLRTRPAEARRLWDHRAQNAALAERYAAVAEEPVPDRLYEALEVRRTSWGMARAAAFLGIVLASGGLGWWFGLESSAGPSPAVRFAALLTEERGAVGTAVSADGRTAGGAPQVQPLGWLSEQVTIPLRLPDLSPFGYAPVERRLVGSHPGQAVEVKYAGGGRKPISLLIAPRWQDDASDVELVEHEGMRIAYGFKGPLGYGVAGDLEEDVIRKVADAVRRAWDRRPTTGTAGIGMEAGTFSVEPVQPMVAHPQAIGRDGSM